MADTSVHPYSMNGALVYSNVASYVCVLPVVICQCSKNFVRILKFNLFTVCGSYLSKLEY